ncbi:hypothetical protein EAE93_09840 [Photorhabdus akhurstii]|nr:hypothetical protein [Photorhabdus akhurstii]
MVSIQRRNAKSLFTIDLATTRLLIILVRSANNYKLTDILLLTIVTLLLVPKAGKKLMIVGLSIEVKAIQ